MSLNPESESLGYAAARLGTSNEVPALCSFVLF
jgi:hypothetical protein